MCHLSYVTPFTLVRQSHAGVLLEEPNQHQLSYLIVFVLIVTEEENSLENLHSVLFCITKKRSV